MGSRAPSAAAWTTADVAVVRNWEFLYPTDSVAALGGEINPIKLLRRRSSLVVADLPVKLGDHAGTNGVARAVPAVFVEPDSNSLLDSFGF